MPFNYFNYQYSLTNFTENAVDCIEGDNLEGIQKLLETDDTLGCKIVYRDFEPSPVYHFALKEGRDDIAYLLYMANPHIMKNTISSNTIRDITITSDILGDAVINRRYELVEKLLNLQGHYKFDVNGSKNTCNMLNNCYFVYTYDTSRQFGFRDAVTYVSSPFMISILLGDVDMYELIKNYKPYFKISNRNCKFHYDNCPKAKIQDDLLINF